MTGRILANRYQLTELIGKGGMALVFLAKDLRTGHDVAVKILRPEFNNDTEFLKRFQREAAAASKMSHHNIVNLLDTGEEDGCRYLVMEYIHGKTLKEVISEKGRLPYETAAQIAIRILSALQHAHNNGIIHRDIKPQNILVHSEGHIKVADFGIARVIGSSTIGHGDMVIGSVHYFSPEQARGEDVTYSSDLYSVGVVLYEMLTGQVPFTGDTPVAVAMQHISAPIRPMSELVPDIPPAFERVVRTAMAKDPLNRYGSALEMAKDLQRMLSSPNEKEEKKSSMAQPKKNTSRTKAVRQSRIKQRIKKIGIAALALLVIASMVYGATVVVSRIINTTEAPYLIGETEDEAIRIAEKAGLKIDVVRQSNNSVPVGEVILQSREYQYRMKRGEVIVITVSSGSPQKKVPDLYGKDAEAARREAERLELTILTVDTVLSNAAVNSVLTQFPAAGEIMDAGGIIQITLSGGSVTVPDVTGSARDQAVSLLRAAGLIVTEIKEEAVEDASKYNLVAAQLPKGGVQVMLNTEVTLAVFVPLPTQTVQTSQTEEPQSTDGGGAP